MFLFLFVNQGKYNKEISAGRTSKLYKTQGDVTISAITVGSRVVQQKDINWSNLIRGNDALTQTKMKKRIPALTPILKP